MALPGPGRPISRRLGDLLVADGLIDPAQLERALAEQRGSREKLGTVLVRLGVLGEDRLLAFLSRQYSVPALALAHCDIAPDVLRLVPESLARAHDVVPVRRSGGTLTLAMSDPTNVLAIDDVARRTGLVVQPAVAAQGAIRGAIDRAYGAQASPFAGAVAAADRPGPDGPAGDDGGAAAEAIELKESADEAPVVRLVNLVLAHAIERGASDIHWEPYEKVFRIRIRVDGMLHELLAPPRRLEPAIISRLKIMASLDIAERRLPQDGRIKLRYREREIDFRVSILPTIFGEKAVLRILARDALQLDLAKLGFDPWGLEQFRQAIRQPHGMVLITGPTGSGKTTTLYSAIHTINAPGVNIMTAEDPVEYNLEGVNQVQINEGIGRTFASALRAFLRQDPDVILVGETRDLETAQIAIRAALTGHLVFSTLHTNDCPSTIARLSDMGVPAFLVASALVLVVAQRLARTVCRNCRVSYDIDAEALAAAGHEPAGSGRLTLARGAGCASCDFTGRRGRVALYEVMPVTPDLRAMILKGTSTSELRSRAQAQGMKTLRQAGLLKVLEGTVAVDEVLRVTAAE